ncbi:MAG: MEDS domain-containing protein [Candidatus Nitrosocosmicus sp.]|nr:MEDS domain-containing protein [Candidatus Nitrosocosmicus sp.]
MFSHIFYTCNNDDLSNRMEIRKKVYNRKFPQEKKSDENLLLNPPANSHILLIYENQFDLDNAISTFINEGLLHSQICVHSSVNLGNKDYLENFSLQITNYKENLEKGNLKIVDLASYYVNVMINNLEPFDALKEEIVTIAARDKNRIDKYIRLTGDCATLLFKNKHFENCISVEEWRYQNPLQGSYLCPYPRSLLKKFPFNAYVSRLVDNHDIIIDSNGKLIQSI